MTKSTNMSPKRGSAKYKLSRTFLLATSLLSGSATIISTVGISIIPTVAVAQDYTTGSIIGTVKDDKGKAVSNANVNLTSESTGINRTFTTDASGRFVASLLPPGEYKALVSANNYNTTETQLKVVVSQEVRYEIAMQSVEAGVEVVVVRGKSRRSDFTKTTTGLNIDLEDITSTQPINRSITAVTLLAPMVSAGNPSFGVTGTPGGASFSGGSVAENAYYIDGLNITNPDTFIGGALIPFDFYKTVEVKTGGFHAEFGRATGGVVNATTKSGTNDFMFALHGNIEPEGWRANSRDTFFEHGDQKRNDSRQYTVEMGGPIIKDRLFAYGLYQFNDITAKQALYRSGMNAVTNTKDPFFGLKIDGYINEDHRLSATFFDTTSKYTREGYNYVAGTRQTGALNPNFKLIRERGGKNHVINYNGKFTDWLSISAAMGRMEDRISDLPANTTDYYVVDTRGGGSTVLSKSQASTSALVTEIERDFYRVDGDLRFEAFGRHHVRFGIDSEKNAMIKTQAAPGSAHATFTYEANPLNPAQDALNYRYLVWGGNVSAEANAMYIQDSWDVTPDLNLQIGVRKDDFIQYNLSGEKYLDLKDNMAVRLGFSWDPIGDGNLKLYGSFGQNYIPPAMSLGFRGRDLDFEQKFAAPAGGFVIDPNTGLPAAVGPALNIPGLHYDSACPTGSSIGSLAFLNTAIGQGNCNVHQGGIQEPANAKAAFDLKPTKDTEVILGLTYRINDLWSVGANYTRRELDDVSEDSDFADAINQYFVDNKLDPSLYRASSGYHVWNPGDRDVTIRLQGLYGAETTQRVVTLTSAQLGRYTKPTRTYQALVFDFKRAFDGKWGLQGSYTLSKSYGNYEGTVTATSNATQDTAGGTYLYDAPGFTDNGKGLLSNHRAHTLKLWGNYALTDNLTVGANVLVQSPARLSCMGYHPTDAYAASYGSISFFCDGKPSGRGKGLKTDWTKNVDMSLRYTMPEKYALGGKLVLRADVFNIFNNQQIVMRRQGFETSGPGVKSALYGMPTFYNTPRYVRVGFDLTY
ncbi:MAG: carboxypeptidase regulatory-like domain-containing protein [Asticcacaulis sp.]